MEYFTENKQQITNDIETDNVEYFAGHNTTSFSAALNFANAIKNELVKVYNKQGSVICYFVGK